MHEVTVEFLETSRSDDITDAPSFSLPVSLLRLSSACVLLRRMPNVSSNARTYRPRYGEIDYLSISITRGTAVKSSVK